MDLQQDKGFIWNIQRYNVHDGEGIRTIVFFKGCPLRCKWCANPEGQKKAGELKVNPERCIGCGLCTEVCPHKAVFLRDSKAEVDREACRACGKCAKVCHTGALEFLGRWATAEEILDELVKDLAFYRRSGGGLTLSGGEALLQADFAARLLQAAKSEGISTAVETCGAVPWAEFEKVLPYADTFLYDLKCMDGKEHKKYTGMSNELILDNAVKLARCGVDLIFRVPVVPGINDSESNIKETAQFARFCNARYLELLPYHPLGTAKYEMLGMAYGLLDTVPPSAEQMGKHGAYARQYFDRIVIGK